MNKYDKQSIPKGYKWTEVGIIPEDWEVLNLHDVAKINMGQSPSSIFYNQKGVGLPLVQGNADILNRKTIIRYYTSQITKKAEAGDLILSVRAPVGAIAKTEFDCCIGRGVCSIKYENDYLYHWFVSFESEWGKLSKGSTFDSINSDDLKFLKIQLPFDKSEQIVISNTLSDADSSIQSLKQLITKKQAIKTATMQQLLTGKTRLPEFAFHADGTPKSTKQSELGVIPEDWSIKRIQDFTDCTAGGTPSTKIEAYWGGTHPWMSSGELHSKKVYDVAERITDLGLKSSSTKYVPSNSVLIGLAGQGKTRGTVAINKISLCTNQSIAAIFPSKEHISEYLFYNLDMRYDELRGLSTGDGGRGGLNLSIIRKLSIFFPKLEEQTAIATILSDMDKEIEALEARLSKAELIKEGMMQELLTGKTRLI